jgi:pimeloyl-ACP methyl ester carboxylesterase
MPYVDSDTNDSDGARIYYETHGSGPGVLFVHGSGGHHAPWWQQVASLSDDYTVITVDLRGFGNTRWAGEHDARNFPGDIVAVLDAVAAAGGPERAVLVGQSIGAAAAPKAALLRRDRVSGVILAHSLGGLRHDELTGLVRADRAVAEKIPVLDRLMTPQFRAMRPDLAFLFRQMSTFNTAKMADLTNLNSDGPAVEVLNAAPFPLLLLAGERDAVLSPATVRRAGELLPNARVEIVTDAPHSMYWERPDLFNDAVRRFLKEVATA